MNVRTPSEEHLISLVGDAVAAPSMHNAQPWRFRYVRQTRTFELYADFDRAMPYSDPRARGLHIGCGAALLNLRVAAAHDGRHAETRLLPRPEDPALLATVRLTGPGGDDSDLAPLHPAITERHSSRFPFEEKRIPDGLRGALVETARREGAALAFPAPWHLQHVLDLVREAEARGLTDRASERELAEWTRTDAPSVNCSDDGVPDYAFGPVRSGGRAPLRDFAGTRRVAGRDTAVFEAAPQIACLSTTHDRPEDWLRAGQAMERVLLLATAEGLVGSLATQPLERPDLRWLLRDPVTGAGHPQMLLRLGYGPKGPRTPRRPVSDVLEVRP
ncbi:Acg family FMN-binding oxidoreductase [Streptomyces rochei]|uniref:Acg family FMN-binding oxidoreductase n=2 Tax=Streptomyces rochei TaxID=1928 RepID=A0ABW7DYL0_STRRO|nr:MULTISPECIES: nitroreductase family protein [Streptomyces]